MIYNYQELFVSVLRLYRLSTHNVILREIPSKKDLLCVDLARFFLLL